VLGYSLVSSYRLKIKKKWFSVKSLNVALGVDVDRFGIIFDLDGTLIDSTSQICEVMNKARAHFGHLTASVAWFEKKIGLPVEELLSDLDISSLEKSEIILLFRDSLRTQMQLGVPIFKDTEKTIENLELLGLPLGIATSKPTDLAKLAISKSSLKRFHFHIRGSDGLRMKPDPDVILRCMEEMKIQNGVYVGDRVEDIQAGRSAGLITIGIVQGFHSKTDFQLEGATFVINSICEITPIIHQISQ
jgi:phosphoglycolate phosphatase